MQKAKKIVLLVALVLFAGLWLLPGQEGNGEIKKAQVNLALVSYLQQKSRTMFAGSEGQYLGFIPGPIDWSQVKAPRVKTFRGAYPPTFDLRTQNKLTPVRNQGSCGSCWAFATYSSLESYGKPLNDWDFSEQDLNAHHGFDAAECAGGNAFISTAYLARWSGPLNESDVPYPYTYGGSVTNLTGFPVQRHVQQAVFLPDRADFLDNDAIKYYVSNHGAVFFAFYYSDYYYNAATYSYYFDGGSYGNHAIAIVGWDDNYPATNFKTGIQPPGNGAFIVRNSWGTSWGQQGYFYISYYDTSIQQLVSFNNAESTNNYLQVYQYDPLGWVGSAGYSGMVTAWGANIFTAVDGSSIAAVGTYATSSDCAYELSIYTGVTSGNPVSGTLALRQSGVWTYPGYYTVGLTIPVAVTAGQKLSVVIRYTTPGYECPVPLEMLYSGYTSAATANPGESFMSSDGTSWTDVSSDSDKTNVCIKAFTGSDGSTPVLELTSPNGGEVWLKGETRSITWSQQNIGGNVHIELYDNLGKVMDIADAPATDGSYSWTIPGTISPGADYRIHITKYSLEDFSNTPFIIAGGSNYLILTSPNGGESWQGGQTYPITWVQNGLSGSVTLSLYKNGVKVQDIGTANATAGYYSWAIPAGLGSGSNYTVRIAQGALADESNHPFIITCTVSVTLVGSINIGLGIYAFDVNGHYAYIAAYDNGLQIVNIADPAHPTWVGSCKTVWALDVMVSDHYACVADTTRLAVIDFANPSLPKVVGNYACRAWGVFVVGNTAYVAARDQGLLIVDITNPAAPVLIGYLLIPDTYDVFVDQGYAYMECFDGNLRIIDVRNSAAPVLAGTLPGGNIFVRNKMAYSTCSPGLKIFDVSNPAAPAELGRWEDSSGYSDIFVSSRYAFLIKSSSGAGSLDVLDIGDPANIFRAGSHSAGSRVRGVDAANGYVYTIGQSGDLEIYKVTYPQPIKVTAPNGGETWLRGTSHDITWTQNGLSGSVNIELFRGTTRVKTIGSAPAAAGSISWTVPADLPNDQNYAVRIYQNWEEDSSDWPFIIAPASGAYLLLNSPNSGETWEIGSTHTISWRQAGLSGQVAIELWKGTDKVLDIGTTAVGNGNYSWTIPVNLELGEDYKIRLVCGSETASSAGAFSLILPAPTYVGSLSIPGYASHICKSGNLVFVGAATGGLQIFNVADPAHPFKVGSIYPGSDVYGVCVQGNMAYLAAFNNFYCVDVSNPAQPVVRGSYTYNYLYDSCTVVGKYAYVPAGNSGLLILDISNPAQPLFVSSYATGGNAQNVLLQDQFLYLADSSKGLHIFNVSNPAAPVLLGVYSHGYMNNVSDVKVRNNDAFVTLEIDNMGVVNVTDKTAPILKSVCGISGNIYAQRLYLQGPYAYICDYGHQMLIVSIADSSNPFLVGRVQTNDNVNDVVVSGHYAYVANEMSGLSIYYLAYPGKSLTINSPNGGESWQMESTHDITWEQTVLSGQVSIELWNGTGKVLDIGTSAADAGTLSWNVPFNIAAGTGYKVRIYQQGIEDYSDNPFSIALPQGVVNIALRKPASQSSSFGNKTGAEAVDGNTDGNFANGSVSHTGNEYQAWWQVDLQGIYRIYQVNVYNRTDCCSERLTNFNVRISTDKVNWQDFNYPGQAGSPTVIVPGGIFGRYVRIQLVGTNYLSLAEVEVMGENSNAGITVTSPNGGENWVMGTSQAITWNAANLTGNVAVALYKGSTKVLDIGSSAADAGALSWNVPFNIAAGTDYKVRIHQEGIEDYSDNPFSIALPQGVVNIALRKPASQSSSFAGKTGAEAVDGNTDGNWANGSVSCTNNEYQAWWQVDLQGMYRIFQVNVYNRTDCCSERLTNFNVRISSDNVKWHDFNYPGQAGSPTVIVPGGIFGRYVRIQLVGTNYLSLAEVEVMGENSSAGIIVTSPNGGETWLVNTQHNITWTGININNVKIEFSSDNGGTWTQVIASTPASSGSFNWTVPDAVSNNCLIQVSDAADNSVKDVSDKVFHIVAPYNQLLSFNGDNISDILWRYQGSGGAVKVWLLSSGAGGSMQRETMVLAKEWAGVWQADETGFLQAGTADPLMADLVYHAGRTGNWQPDVPESVERSTKVAAAMIPELSGMSAAMVSVTELALPAAVDLNWKLVGKGDFNRDGILDLLWRNSATGGNVIWFMGGSQNAQIIGTQWLPEVTDQNWEVAGVADQNGDGQLDILLRNYANGTNVWWILDNYVIVDTVLLPSVPDLNYRIEAVMDMNNDGIADVVWRNYATGGNVMWFMGGVRNAQITGAQWLPEVTDLNWKLVGVGNIDNQNGLDFVWRHQVYGWNVVWFMTDYKITGTFWLPTVEDLAWKGEL